MSTGNWKLQETPPEVRGFMLWLEELPREVIRLHRRVAAEWSKVTDEQKQAYFDRARRLIAEEETAQKNAPANPE